MARDRATNYSLTEGNIFQKLLLVAVPIMGSQLVQMAYNLTDMFWLGRVGSTAVAASGSAGMYTWLAISFMLYGRNGAEIGVSQNLGAGNMAKARSYAETSLSIAVILGLICTALMFIFRVPLIGFFKLQEAVVATDAIKYLSITAFGMPFCFFSLTTTGIYNGSGNSRLPFFINCGGLGLNMLLDPILILGLEMDISGAAVATVVAQGLSAGLSYWALRYYRHRPFAELKIFRKPERRATAQILRWGTPLMLENFFFCLLSMIVTRMITGFGAGALAAYRISTQIESLSWLVAGGYGMALTSFIGQNYGAGRWSRIQRCFGVSCRSMVVYGLGLTALLYFAATPLITLFIPREPDVVALGAASLRILAIAQVAICLESVGAGFFHGLGRTLPPSVVSIACNALRVIVAWIFLQAGAGLYTIWLIVSLGAIVRGMGCFIWYWLAKRHQPQQDTTPLSAV